MPIYVEDCLPLLGTLQSRHLKALIRMWRAVGNDALNPATAMQLLRTYVQPLVPVGHWQVFVAGGQPTWAGVHYLYPDLAFASGGVDENLLGAATLVNIVYRHSTRPPRELPSQQFVEVTAFTNVCGTLGLGSTPPAIVVGRTKLRLHEFCRYCWLPARAYGNCGHHARHVADAPDGSLPRCAAATFKQVQRLRPEFEEEARALATAETLAFHETAFSFRPLLPLAGLEQWIVRHRPHLALSLAIGGPGGGNLLRFLYGEYGSQVAETIGEDIHLLTPVTTRAEAWLRAWAQRPGRGGARVRRHT